MVTGFIQRLPDEGQPARQQTELRLAYDDDAIYVGARLHDSEPARIVRRLTRRDVVADADRFSIFFDPHHDHLTGVEFRVTAAGVQKDAVIYNDVYQDDTWDAVWESAVGRDDGGLGRRDADSVLAAALSAGRRAHLGRQRPAHRPAQRRRVVGVDHAEQRERPGLADAPPGRARRASRRRAIWSCCPT